MCKSSGMSSTRISRHVNAPRAVYQAPAKSSFLIRADIINRTRLLPRNSWFSKPNSKR